MPRYLSRETEPFGKWNGIPIYLTTIFTAVMALGFVVCAFLISARSPLFVDAMFVVPRSGWGNLLAVFTYSLVNEISFFTPFAIFCFYWWAIGIESHLGRSVLVRLVALLVGVPALVSTICAYSLSFDGRLAGNFLLTAGLVVAFATLYPNSLTCGFIPFKFVAAACVFCGSLMMVSQIELGMWRFVSLASLWSVCLAAFLYIRHALEQEYDDAVPLMARVRGWFRPKPKFRVVPKDAPSAEHWRAPAEPESAVSAEVDAILEKVARNGKDSLTAAETAKLQKASEDLQRRDRR
jgi:hypothetical protein